MVKTGYKKAIIFDWGGVIFKDGFGEALKHYAQANGLTYIDFHNLIHGIDKTNTENLWWKFSTGRISEKEYWAGIRRNFRNTRAVNNIRDWNYQYSVPITGSVEIIRNLKNRYSLGLLTNHTREWFSHFDKTHPGKKIHRMFDVVVNSADVGVKKPDRKIYQIMLERLDVYPDQSIFIDDKEQNVEAAQKVGIDSIVFLNSSQLQKELASRGILV